MIIRIDSVFSRGYPLQAVQAEVTHNNFWWTCSRFVLETRLKHNRNGSGQKISQRIQTDWKVKDGPTQYYQCVPNKVPGEGCNRYTYTYKPNSKSWSPGGRYRVLKLHNVALCPGQQDAGGGHVCGGLTRIDAAVTEDEHEQQNSDNGCNHPTNSCSNHSGVQIVAWFH